MKWIAVILALVNVVAYLIGMKAQPVTAQAVHSSGYEQINIAAMSVIRPDEQLAIDAAKAEEAAETLKEDSLAQLEVNRQGKVLTKEEDKKSAKADVASKTASVVTAKTPDVDDAKKAPKKAVAPVSTLPESTTPAAEPAQTASVEKTSETSVDAKEALACYRLGPFKNPKRLASLRERLKNQGVAYQVDESGAEQRVKAVRVYAGPFADEAALNKQKQQLETMGVEYFVIHLKGKPLLQLGYFSEPARASNYQLNMKSRGLVVKSDTIYLEESVNMALELANVSENTIKALDISKGVEVAAHPCR